MEKPVAMPKLGMTMTEGTILNWLYQEGDMVEKGEPLVGRLLTFDALSAEFQELKLYRNPTCPACGANAHPEDLPTYEEICAL